MRAKLESSGADGAALSQCKQDNEDLKKQLSTTAAKLSNATQELTTLRQALGNSQKRVDTLTAAVAAADEAAAEKWKGKIEEIHASHREQHAAATQAWHEHSASRLDALKQHLEDQFHQQTEELQQRCHRLQVTNAQLEETNTETLQAAEQAAQLANDLMAQLSESERLRAGEQTKFNAQVLTLKQAVRNVEREKEATADENHSLKQQLTKMHAQIDHYASLLEAEEEHHSIANRPAAPTRLLPPPRAQLTNQQNAQPLPPHSPFRVGEAVPKQPDILASRPLAEHHGRASPPKPPPSPESKSIQYSVGYGGLLANFGLPGVMPVSPGY